jgi:hypothetical protein
MFVRAWDTYERKITVLQLFTNLIKGVFSLTELGAVLCKDSPGSLRYMIMGETDKVHTKSWTNIHKAVIKGGSVTEESAGCTVWEYYERNEHDAITFMLWYLIF